jgi:membrane-bound serine protease (ClpP class)
MFVRFFNKKLLRILFLFLLSSGIFVLFYFNSMSLPLFADDNFPNSNKYNGNAEEVTVINKFHICKIEGIIDPVISNYISKALAEAQEEQSALIILIDTPGGLETSMREITLNCINTPIPVISFVYPDGSRAASAGVFIVYASDIAAMAPNSSIGAAHPVTLGNDQGITEEQMDKIVNDSVSFIKNLASLNNRDWQWAEKAIRESVSITSGEALELNVINYIAADTEDLINIIDARIIKKQNQTFQISSNQYSLKSIDMSFVAKFLHIIINPNIAYILFTLGLLGIIYEFSQPGLGVSGALGVIFLILGLYSFSILPTNYAGLALIVIAIILFILDLKLNLGGILSIAGIASMIIGSFMLIDTAAPYLQIAKSLIIGLSIAISAFLIIVVRAVYAVHRKKPVTGNAGMFESFGQVIEDLKPLGLIKTHGEIWKAQSFDGITIKKGESVKIISSAGLTLFVKKVEDEKTGT